MREAVLIFSKSQEGRKLCRDGSGAVHISDLVGQEARGVGLDCKIHQIEHRLDQLAGGFIIGIGVESVGVDPRFGNIEPLFGSFDPLLDLADGLEVFIDFF